MRSVPLLVAVLAAMTVGGSARAQASGETLPSLDARTWRPSTDPFAGLVNEPVSTQESWNVGAFLHYTHHPVTLRRPGASDVVSRPLELVVGSDLVAGIGLGSRAAAGLSLPLSLYQNGSNGLPQTVSSTGSVPTTA